MKLPKPFFKKSGAVIDKNLNYHDAMDCVDSLVRCAKSPLEKVRAYNYALFVIKADFAAYSKTRIISKVDSEHIAIIFEIARRKSVLLKSLDSRTEEYCRENGGAFIKSKRRYTVICGMPCSGKSTYIGAGNHCGDVLIDDETDMDKFRLLIEQRECIIDENVFTGNAAPRMRLARDSGYYVCLCFIGIGSADECIRRSELRLQKTGVRQFSDEVIRESLKNYPRLIAQMLDLCDSADFCDNENGFRYVARWDGKTFNFISGDMPDWLCKIHLAWLDLNSQA